MKVLTLVVAPAGIWLFSAGCGVAVQGGDGLTISGSPEGIKSFSDLLAGTAINAKSPAEANDTPYFQLRRTQAQLRVIKRKGGTK